MGPRLVNGAFGIVAGVWLYTGAGHWHLASMYRRQEKGTDWH
jgi:hypothetical protein